MLSHVDLTGNSPHYLASPARKHLKQWHFCSIFVYWMKCSLIVMSNLWQMQQQTHLNFWLEERLDYKFLTHTWTCIRLFYCAKLLLLSFSCLNCEHKPFQCFLIQNFCLIQSQVRLLQHTSSTESFPCKNQFSHCCC